MKSGQPIKKFLSANKQTEWTHVNVEFVNSYELADQIKKLVHKSVCARKVCEYKVIVSVIGIPGPAKVP